MLRGSRPNRQQVEPILASEGVTCEGLTLSGADLSRLDLTDVDLTRANFEGSPSNRWFHIFFWIL